MSRDFGRVRRIEGSGGGVVVILDPGKEERESPGGGLAAGQGTVTGTGTETWSDNDFTADLLNEDCENISDWGDWDSGDGISEVSPAGRGPWE